MQNHNKNKPHWNIILANPRGFCAGVDRAVSIVEQAEVVSMHPTSRES